MIVAIVAIAMLFGATASVWTLVAGGSVLWAIAVYSGVGVAAALTTSVMVLILSSLRATEPEWSDAESESRTASA